MQDICLITFRSITYAQKAERLLKRAGLTCSLPRTPRELSERGCGYCLRLPKRDTHAAVELLRENQQMYGKVYSVTDGRPEVWQL